MINGNISEFVDNLYYGTEMYFTYNNKKYFVQGWVKEGSHYLILDYDYETEVYDPSDSKCNRVIWEYSSKDAGECVKAFLDAPLWDGRTFYEAEKEMMWTD